MGGIRFEADGTVTIVTGTLDYGQGHWTPFAQVLHAAARHAVRPDPAGAGRQRPARSPAAAPAARSRIMASGAAIVGGARQGDRAAAGRSPPHVLEAGVGDIEFADGRFTIAGTDRGIGIMELAERLRGGAHGCRRTCRASLDVNHVHKAFALGLSRTAATSPRSRSTPRPGRREVVRYAMVNDFGTVVNPMLVEGQLHGGVVQGIGQALHGAHRLRRRGPARDRLLHGLRPAARRRRAGLRLREPSGPGDDQPARRQGLRRGRLRRRAALGDERASSTRCAESASTHIDMPATPERVWAALAEAAE